MRIFFELTISEIRESYRPLWLADPQQRACGPLQTPVRRPSEHHVPVLTKMLYFSMYTETDFVLCTGLQLQPTVYCVNDNCSHYSVFTQSTYFEPCTKA